MDYQNDTRMLVQPISYSSSSLSSAQTNSISSTVQAKLNEWYDKNLANYALNLADATFCNDRSRTSGTGYKTDSYTFYGAYDRLAHNRIPSLKCIQNNDKFKTSNINAKLNHPIGLILADEVAYAGGKLFYNSTYWPNTDYYLYNGNIFWTLSPSSFDTYTSHSCVLSVLSSGSLYSWHFTNYSYGIRPVINLRADLIISKGDGTALNPYVIK